MTIDPSRGGPYAPYVQSQRSEIYKQEAENLIQSNKAYKCFCSSERLQSIKDRAVAAKRPPRYDGKCRHLSDQEIHELEHTLQVPYTVRFKVPLGTTRFKDLVHGSLGFSNRVLDDLILLKSDGLPTYHLANVVDDHYMKITHVVRGEVTALLF
jgi:glutamyl/glutaminyl-tRNA synthetase